MRDERNSARRGSRILSNLWITLCRGSASTTLGTAYARSALLPRRRQNTPPWFDRFRELHATGRPVLVGSRTIENSQRLASALAAAGVPFQLLNGKQTADEAAVVARPAPWAQ